MRSYHYLLAATLALSLSGCVRSEAFRLHPVAQAYPPVPADSVKMYSTLERLDREYVQVAVVSARGDADFTSEQQLLHALRTEAGKVGCNAIVLSEMRTPSTGARVARWLLGTPAERQAGVVCIRILDPPGEI